MKQFIDVGADALEADFLKRGTSLADNPVLKRTISCVYSLQSQATGKAYIGSSKDLLARVWYSNMSHKAKLSRGKAAKKLQAHVDNFGISDLLVQVLELCPADQLLSLEAIYCLSARQDKLLNSTVDGDSRGKRIKDTSLPGFKPWWAKIEPTRGRLAASCASDHRSHKVAQCVWFGKLFPDCRHVAELIGKPSQTVHRWLKDSRYSDCYYVTPND